MKDFSVVVEFMQLGVERFRVSELRNPGLHHIVRNWVMILLMMNSQG